MPGPQELYDKLAERSRVLSELNRALQDASLDAGQRAALREQRASLMQEIDALCERIRESMKR